MQCVLHQRDHRQKNGIKDFVFEEMKFILLVNADLKG